MDHNQLLEYTTNVLKNIPADWLNLTTHRLDRYNESLAKSQFLNEFEALFESSVYQRESLQALPTAYDYIRLGHPLSCILEWMIAKSTGLKPQNVICFSSETMPLMAVLRKNLLENKATQIQYTDELPKAFNMEKIKKVYGYDFELKKLNKGDNPSDFEGTSILISKQDGATVELDPSFDLVLKTYPMMGSVLHLNSKNSEDYLGEVQHVRRRETIAMTPANCLSLLEAFVGESKSQPPSKCEDSRDIKETKESVLGAIAKVACVNTKAAVGSSGLSIQYAISMGLIEHALEKYPGKSIRFIVPPNCYGGTNDQARRMAACIPSVEILDLAVDRGRDMVSSLDRILEDVALEDAVPYIIAEIPTNPRVEVPDLDKLQIVLSKERLTKEGKSALSSVFILDQTFCPNINFLGEGGALSSTQAISYVSGSKFPSGGLCTAGYCIGNKMTKSLMVKVDSHLTLCGNEATHHQYEILAKQLPSMNDRIQKAYLNTREFVDFIKDQLPEAKINFVSDELAQSGFTPSVFSLDLPTKGDSDEERESYKRNLNLRLIEMMIKEISGESKHCVSYGQLKGCYWTIPATSTQGTTKEGDKDYIVRVSMSPELDLDLHKKVFKDFVGSLLGD